MRFSGVGETKFTSLFGRDGVGTDEAQGLVCNLGKWSGQSGCDRIGSQRLLSSGLLDGNPLYMDCKVKVFSAWQGQ